MLQATAAPSPLAETPEFSQSYFAAYRWMLQALNLTLRPVSAA